MFVLTPCERTGFSTLAGDPPAPFVPGALATIILQNVVSRL